MGERLKMKTQIYVADRFCDRLASRCNELDNGCKLREDLDGLGRLETENRSPKLTGAHIA